MNASADRCHCLFLSPHLDDVVLSCALRLLKECREGKTVVVATIFSRAVRLLPGKDLYEGRQQEDRKALKILGASNPLWLDFPDAPFRSLFYTSFQSIVLGKHAEDASYAETISKRVALLYEEYMPETIFIPLAIGTHIDHRLTHNIWRSLPPNANIIFYEDRPYVFLPHSLALRLAEIGAQTSQLGLSDSLVSNTDFLRDFAQGLRNITLYKKILIWKNDRFRYLLWARRKLKLSSQAPNLKIEAEIIGTAAMEDVVQTEKAIAAYKSQMGMLYKHIDIFKQESAAYARTFDAASIYAERYWKLVR